MSVLEHVHVHSLYQSDTDGALTLLTMQRGLSATADLFAVHFSSAVEVVSCQYL